MSAVMLIVVHEADPRNERTISFFVSFPGTRMNAINTKWSVLAMAVVRYTNDPHSVVD